jgi:hypothetical protein
MGVMYQGSINSGQGLPSLANWANRQKASWEKKTFEGKNKFDTMKASADMLQTQATLMDKMQHAKTDEEKKAIVDELEGHGAGILLRVLWCTTTVDITSTIYEVTHMVMYDMSVDKETRLRRAKAVEALGEVWMNVPEPENLKTQNVDAKKIYEEAAFAAMLETVKRRDPSQSS